MARSFRKWHEQLAEQYGIIYPGHLKFRTGDTSALVNDNTSDSNKTIQRISEDIGNTNFVESANLQIPGNRFNQGNISKNLLGEQETILYQLCADAHGCVISAKHADALEILNEMCEFVQRCDDITYEMAYLYSWGLHLKGSVALDQRNYVEAEYRFEQSMKIKIRIGDVHELHILQTKTVVGYRSFSICAY